MQVRLLLSATLMAAFVPVAVAQDSESQQQPAPAPQQQAKPPKPPAPPKPKPAAAPAPAKKPAPVPVVAAPAVGPKAKLLEKVGDWSVFIYEEAGGRVCFAASAPTDMQPKTATAKRTPVVFYITDWQKDGVRSEVSVKLGYAVKPKSTAAVTAGGRNFSLPADDDKAFAKDGADEQKLLAAMAGGGPMVVKATSAKGTATTDQYSLEGLGTALQKAQAACQ
jgi:Invasion associated locus B (IalB) protein